jgi:DNA-binding response OmpR family regulator
MYILYVEDDARVGRAVGRGLTDAGHRVDLAGNGPEGLERAATGAYDLIVLDVLLPGMDGMAICRELRRQGVTTPVLMLTARDAIGDRVRGLDAGADDYLVKPFALAELLARIRALGRRGDGRLGGEVLTVGDLRLDLEQRQATRGDRSIELTAKEFQLLEYLMRHAGRLLTKDQILHHVWGYDAEVSSNVTEIYVHYLRDKIDRGFADPLIRTVRGAGYMLKE